MLRMLASTGCLLALALPARAQDKFDRFDDVLPPGAVQRLQAAHLREPILRQRTIDALLQGLTAAGDDIAVSRSGDFKQTLVRYWNVQTGDELPPPRTALPPGIGLSFSSDGKYVAVAQSRSPAGVYERETGRLVFDLDLGNRDFCRFGHFSPDNRHVVGVSEKGQLAFWTLAGQRIGQHDVGRSWVLAIHPVGDKLALGTDDGQVRIITLPGGKVMRQWQAHDKTVTAGAWTPDGQTLATLSLDTFVHFWSADGKHAGRSLRNYGHRLQISPDGKWLALDNAGIVAVYAIASRTLVYENKMHFAGANGLAFSKDATALAWTDQSVAIKMTRIVNGQWTDVVPERLLPIDLVYSADGKQIVTGGDTYVRHWDAESGAEAKRQALRGARLDNAPAGKHMALVHGDAIRLFDSTGKELDTQPCPLKKISRVAFSRQGDAVIVAGGPAVQLWDVVGGNKLQLRHTLKGHRDALADVAFRPDGKWIVSAGDDRTVRFWDAGNGAPLGDAHKLDVPIGSLAWSPDGKSLAAGDWEGTLWLWDVDRVAAGVELKLVRRFRPHADHIAALVFAADGRSLATASWDGKVCVCDPVAGSILETFAGHRDEAIALAFSPDGRSLASGSRDHTVLIWRLGAR